MELDQIENLDLPAIIIDHSYNWHIRIKGGHT